MYEMRLGLGIGSLWAGYHLPWLSSTGGDWDTLRGNMGHTHTHKNTHTQINGHIHECMHILTHTYTRIK